MVETFCLRLACGMIAILPILPAAVVPPRFYRVQFLAALGLLAVAGVFLYESAGLAFWATFVLAAAGCVLGSIVWHVDDAPFGRLALWLTAPALLACLVLGGMAAHPQDDGVWRIADDLSSLAVLGAATSAMLMGHAYLIAPAMSMTPLNRLLGALGVALAVRIALACLALWLWRNGSGGAPEGELLVWLPARWLLGLFGPLALGWMAWETARIRSTQSATGILYVVVIVCYLGELTSQLLLEKTGLLL